MTWSKLYGLLYRRRISSDLHHSSTWTNLCGSMFIPMISSMRPRHRLACLRLTTLLATFEKSSLFRTVIGVGKDSLDAFLGAFPFIISRPPRRNVTLYRFGYLHRIPSQPTDRKVLDALQEHTDLEDQQLFVPADVSRNTAPYASVSGDHSHFPRHPSPVVAHPHPTRAREMTRRSIDHQLGRDARTTSRPNTPKRSSQTPGPYSQPPVTSRSFGSPLNGDSSPQS